MASASIVDCESAEVTIDPDDYEYQVRFIMQDRQSGEIVTAVPDFPPDQERNVFTGDQTFSIIDADWDPGDVILIEFEVYEGDDTFTNLIAEDSLSEEEIEQCLAEETPTPTPTPTPIETPTPTPIETPTPDTRPAISFVAFCADEPITADEVTITDVETKPGEPDDPISLSWESDIEVSNVTYKAGMLPIHQVEGGTNGSFEVTDGIERIDLSPPQPCDTEYWVKFEWNGDFSPESITGLFDDVPFDVGVVVGVLTFAGTALVAVRRS